jgi:adenosylmethionine-8-amino-7-oxononanoate aminotransferase
MHRLFRGSVPQQLFAPAPPAGFETPCHDDDVDGFARLLWEHEHAIAAVILEPIVQGAGGMRFYCPEYLRRVRQLTEEAGVLLIHDEIATGFGRTGRMFASEHADVVPDILCVGKALTGGYVTLGATLATRNVAEGVSHDGHVFMHGPTFMANPLACAIASTSLDLLAGSPWQENVHRIHMQLANGLAPCRTLPHVADVRTLGAIGVVELRHPVPVAAYQREFVERGVWIRPFGRLVYVMPPFIIDPDDVESLTSAINEVVQLNPME